jgi:hypothetical protein
MSNKVVPIIIPNVSVFETKDTPMYEKPPSFSFGISSAHVFPQKIINIPNSSTMETKDTPMSEQPLSFSAEVSSNLVFPQKVSLNQ